MLRAITLLLSFLSLAPSAASERPPSQLIESVNGSLREIENDRCFAQVLERSLAMTECREMTEDHKTGIALAFTQCHYERHRRARLPCEEGRPFN